MDFSRLLTDRQEICIQVWCGVKPVNLPAKKIYQPIKKFGGVETSNFADLPPIWRQSEARNFETAQYIDKQNYTVSTKNAPPPKHV